MPLILKEIPLLVLMRWAPQYWMKCISQQSANKRKRDMVLDFHKQWKLSAKTLGVTELSGLTAAWVTMENTNQKQSHSWFFSLSAAIAPGNYIHCLAPFKVHLDLYGFLVPLPTCQLGLSPYSAVIKGRNSTGKAMSMILRWERLHLLNFSCLSHNC